MKKWIKRTLLGSLGLAVALSIAGNVVFLSLVLVQRSYQSSYGPGGPFAPTWEKDGYSYADGWLNCRLIWPSTLVVNKKASVIDHPENAQAELRAVVFFAFDGTFADLEREFERCLTAYGGRVSTVSAASQASPNEFIIKYYSQTGSGHTIQVRRLPQPKGDVTQAVMSYCVSF